MTVRELRKFLQRYSKDAVLSIAIGESMEAAIKVKSKKGKTLAFINLESDQWDDPQPATTVPTLAELAKNPGLGEDGYSE